jgi:hypothetical protein
MYIWKCVDSVVKWAYSSTFWKDGNTVINIQRPDTICVWK